MLSNLLSSLPAECTTRDVAQALGLAVRSVQLMVNRGELEAWKTPGGHRRIPRASVERWLASRRTVRSPAHGTVSFGASNEGSFSPEMNISSPTFPENRASGELRQSVLLIEDSAHFQTLVRLLLSHSFPDVNLHVADDGIVGLAMIGKLVPSVVILDILLPGIDGATLVGRLRTHPHFQLSKLIIITSLEEQARQAYDFALSGLPVVHKPHLARDLPPLIARALARVAS